MKEFALVKSQFLLHVDFIKSKMRVMRESWVSSMKVSHEHLFELEQNFKPDQGSVVNAVFFKRLKIFLGI